MAETTYQAESIPATYPTVTGLSAAAQALDADFLWQRIEAYTARRWTARNVIWMATGPGEWVPPLSPAEVVQAFAWNGAGWDEITLPPAPRGFELQGGRYKINATVGADETAPAAVLEAFRRLAEYVAADTLLPAGLRSYSANEGQLSETVSGDPARAARALQNSGAADLLRPYRRA